MIARSWIRILLLGIVMLGSLVSVGATESQWDVSGAGWLNNRQLKRQLQVMLPEQGAINANDVEDAVMVILSMMQEKGFLDAKVVTYLEGMGNEGESTGMQMWEMRWDRRLETFFEREVQLDRVQFEVEPGPVFFFRNFEVRESAEMDPAWVERFFFKTPMLFQGDRVRLFHPGRFERGGRNLESYLAQLGYREAQVECTMQSMNMESGEVDAFVRIERGPIHELGSVELIGELPASVFLLSFDQWVGQPYSREVRQDVLSHVRNALFAEGFPDVAIESEQVTVDAGPPVLHRLVLQVDPGPRVRFGQIELHGLVETRESFVRKKMLLREGDPFDPLKLDQDRLTISRTGLFDRVDLEAEQEGEVRQVRFDVAERFPWTLDLIAGWGSYEQFRLGSTLKRDNLWGQAHQMVLSAVVSMKSRFGDAVYTIPDIRRSGVNLNFRAFVLNREEISFDRREQGLDLGITKRFERMRLDSSLVYTIEVLESLDRQGRLLLQDEDSRVGSIALRLNHDDRDSPITPQSGYRIFSNLEWADEFLGGNVSFWNMELGFSLHGHFGSGLFWHAGISHGIVFTSDGNENFIPTNKLYFPGGDDSIRGYQRGEAAPRDADGFLVGARSSALINLELEQFLTESISAVLFYDWLGTSTRSVAFGYDESLQSVGIGVRWKTVIGPVRLEYGHNLKRRSGDPDGTLHLALGVPF